MSESKSSATNSKWLGIIVALQIVTVVGQWVATPSATPALAQIPDSGAQRNEIIEQLKQTNQRLDKLITLLSDGNLQVKLAKSDESKGP